MRRNNTQDIKVNFDSFRRQIVKSYVSAMTGAVGVSVIANRLVKVTDRVVLELPLYFDRELHHWWVDLFLSWPWQLLTVSTYP